jgi:ribosomal protein S18 acetylase RimI-like enzyme
LIAKQPPGPLPPPAAPAPAPAPVLVPIPASTAQATVVGYAAFGPEQGLDGRPRTARGGPRPAQSPAAELYALYVAPAYWSTGAGRALMGRVLAEAQAKGYPRIVLWVLEQNARARRFYERAGFRQCCRTHQLDWLGGRPRGLLRPGSRPGARVTAACWTHSTQLLFTVPSGDTEITATEPGQK